MLIIRTRYLIEFRWLRVTIGFVCAREICPLLFVVGRIPSQKYRASIRIRPSDEYPPSQKHEEASIRSRKNTLSKTWGKYSSTDGYPLKNMGQAFVHDGRIHPEKTWASIRTRTNTLCKTREQVFVWTNTLSKTWGKHLSVDDE